MARKTKKPTPKSATKVLDEKTSALVIAEYLSLEGVETSEIDDILEREHALSFREIALTFRISEVLEVNCCFEIAPKYRLAFERARAVLKIINTADSDVSAGRDGIVTVTVSPREVAVQQ